MPIPGKTIILVIVSLLGSLAVVDWFSRPFKDRREIQQKLKSAGAFSVSFTPDGSVGSVRFHGVISNEFPELCPKLYLIDLKGVQGIRKNLEILTRLNSLGMIVLSGSDVSDEDIPLLGKISGVKHLWLTKTNLTEKCIDQLASLKDLESIKLDGTQMGSEAIQRLRLLKPGLKIEGPSDSTNRH